MGKKFNRITYKIVYIEQNQVDKNIFYISKFIYVSKKYEFIKKYKHKNNYNNLNMIVPILLEFIYFSNHIFNVNRNLIISFLLNMKY